MSLPGTSQSERKHAPRVVAERVAERVVSDLLALQQYIEIHTAWGDETKPRPGWEDLEALLRLARMEAARQIEREGRGHCLEVDDVAPH